MDFYPYIVFYIIFLIDMELRLTLKFLTKVSSMSVSVSESKAL